MQIQVDLLYYYLLLLYLQPNLHILNIMCLCESGKVGLTGIPRGNIRAPITTVIKHRDIMCDLARWATGGEQMMAHQDKAPRCVK